MFIQKIPNCLIYRDLRIDADLSALYAAVVFTRGDVIRKWREKKGWKAETLAKQAGVDRNTITRVESDGSLRDSTLARVVRALGHTMAELYAAVARYGGDADEEVSAVLQDATLRQLVSALARQTPEFRQKLLESPALRAAGSSLGTTLVHPPGEVATPRKSHRASGHGRAKRA